MCYKWRDNKIEKYPTLQQYKNFISDFRELVDDGFMLHFGGGEALLYEGVLDLVKYSVQKGFLTNVISNGWLIDESMSKRIADSGLHELVLSLDSLHEETHDYLRGVKGVYRRVMKAAEYLHAHCHDTKIGICSVIYDWNLDELMPLLEWVNANAKIRSIIFMAPMQPNSTAVEKKWWNGKFNCLWPHDALKAAAFVEKVIELKKTYHKIGNQIPQLEALRLYFLHPEEFVKKTQCNLDRAVHVSAVGEVFLCYRWDICGDIRKGDDIRDIWRSEMAGRVRQKIATCKDNCHFLLNCFFEGDSPLGLEK
jgi:MoaA/NifB/PqqE/SkfB family radical SAM enzyme